MNQTAESAASKPTKPAEGAPASNSIASIQTKPSANAPPSTLPQEVISPTKTITQAQVTVSPQPIELKIDTPTDWPAVALPFVLGAIGIFFTLMSQAQQIRASTAQFRNEWLKEVRSAAVEFGAASMEVQVACGKNPNFMTTAQAFELMNRAFIARTKLVLMLDEKQQYTKDISKAIGDVLKEAHVYSPRFDAAMLSFETHARIALETAWQDIRRDLGQTKKSARTV